MLFRVRDILFSFLFLCVSMPIFICVYLIYLFKNDFPIIFWADRVGKNNQLFKMPKFRTMSKNTPIVPTDEFKDHEKFISNFGSFLRKSSIDELPQLFLVLTGKMSLVGPRPLMPSQKFPIHQREKLKIHTLKPGITGWAQINGRDNIDDQKKVDLDLYYFQNRSLFFDFYIIYRTFVKVINKDGISH